MTEVKPDNKGKKTKGRDTPPTIDIYKTWCKGCGLCASFCPTGSLARDEAGYPYVKDINKCINCGLCEIRCPDFAITVRQQSKEGTKKHEETQEDGKEGTAPPG
jgi:2-oxoglutarate ferredoxin oxidoreductase subunit delta